MNLSEAIAAYLQMRRAKYSPTTWPNDESSLNRLLRHVGDIPLTDLTPDRVSDLFYAPETGLVHQLRATTFNVNKSRITQFCKWATSEGLIDADPMRKVERRKELKRERMRLTGPQMAALIESAEHPRDRILLSLACNTGLRIRDIINLRVGDVDLDSGYLRARISKNQQEKLLPITADLDGELRMWLRFYSYECSDTLEPEWYLVPRRHEWGWVRNAHGKIDDQGSSLIPDQPFAFPFRVIHKALDAIGVDDKGEGFHTLRRSAGRCVYDRAVALGDPAAIHVAQAFYGHAEARMTQYYIGTDEERRKLDKLMRGRKFLSPEAHALP